MEINELEMLVKSDLLKILEAQLTNGNSGNVPAVPIHIISSKTARDMSPVAANIERADVLVLCGCGVYLKLEVGGDGKLFGRCINCRTEYEGKVEAWKKRGD